MPQTPGDRQPCFERSRFKNGSFDAAQAPELRPGLNPLVLTRSVIVGYHLQLEGQARPLWPVRADQAESGYGQWPRAGPLAASESGLLTARHRQVPLLRQMQGNAGGGAAALEPGEL